MTESSEDALAYEPCGRIERRNGWKKQRRRKMLKNEYGLGLGVVVGGNLEEGLHAGFLEAWMRTCLTPKGILERPSAQILRKKDPHRTQK